MLTNLTFGRSRNMIKQFSVVGHLTLSSLALSYLHIDHTVRSDVCSVLKSNEVGGSTYMEKAGLTRSIDLLEANKLHVDVLITDRHPQIQKYVRESKPSIAHYYDVWHVAKGMCTVLLCSLSFVLRIHKIVRYGGMAFWETV